MNDGRRRRCLLREARPDFARRPVFFGRTGHCFGISEKKGNDMKKLITAIAFAFVAAVASVQAAGSSCAECCKDKECAECCKGKCAECAGCNK